MTRRPAPVHRPGAAEAISLSYGPAHRGRNCHRIATGPSGLPAAPGTRAPTCDAAARVASPHTPAGSAVSAGAPGTHHPHRPGSHMRSPRPSRPPYSSKKTAHSWGAASNCSGSRPPGCTATRPQSVRGPLSVRAVSKTCPGPTSPDTIAGCAPQRFDPRRDASDSVSCPPAADFDERPPWSTARPSREWERRLCVPARR